jgi:polyprenyl-phospho-N-acetylgalactosaminyl synthase
MGSKHKDTYVIIPAHNEESVIFKTISSCFKYFHHIVVVDDGSSDNTAQEAERAGAIVVRHPTNLGQGASLQTGIDFALSTSSAKFFVTYDADGQHRAEDALKMVQHLKSNRNIDIVLGSRFLGSTVDITRSKRIFLKMAVAFSNLTGDIRLTDAHNGLRAFNRHTAENLTLQMSDMAHASEIVHRITEKNLKYTELPVTIVYTDYSKSKGQSLFNAVNISFDMILNRISKK